MHEINFILYNLPEENGNVQVVVKDETIWCSQKAMALLFGVGVPAINKHLGHIFDEGELEKEVVVSKMEITTQHGAKSEITKEFFAMVQNKFHYAITGQTAPEIIFANADHSRENMGLKTWKNSPDRN